MPVEPDREGRYRIVFQGGTTITSELGSDGIGTTGPSDRPPRAVYSARRIWGVVFALAVASRLAQAAAGVPGDRPGPFLNGSILAQAAVSGWFLLGRSPRRFLAAFDTALLMALSAVSLRFALAGSESCGCYGAVAVSPWWTATFAMVAAAHSLAGGWLKESTNPGPLGLGRFGGAYLMTAVALAVAFVGQVGLEHYRHLREFLGGEGIVASDPSTWIDREFPLSDRVEGSLGADLHQGEWLVVLHRRQCPKCRDIVRRMTEWGNRPPATVPGAEPPRVALIEVPSPDMSTTAEAANPGRIMVGRLTGSRAWTFETPLVVRLSDGQVVSVQGAGDGSRGAGGPPPAETE